MLERLAPAALAAMLLGLALTGAVPAGAQTTTEAATEKPAAAAEQPASPAATPPATPANRRQLRHLLQQPTPAVAEPPPPPPVDPLLAEVRRQLAEPPRGNVDRADRAALTAFYARAQATRSCGSPRTASRPRRAMPWPRSPRPTTGASPRAPSSCRSSPQGEAVAGRARRRRDQARPRRPQVCAPRPRRPLDPAAAQQAPRQKPTLREPKVVLEAVAATDTPGDYLRDLHPKHQQFQRLRQALLKARGGGSAARPAEPVSADPTAVRLPDGPQLKLGSEHPHVALLRQRLGVPAVARAPRRFSISSCRRRSRPSRAATTSRPRAC